MPPAGKELPYVEYFRKYEELGHLLIILYFFGDLTSGEYNLAVLDNIIPSLMGILKSNCDP